MTRDLDGLARKDGQSGIGLAVDQPSVCRYSFLGNYFRRCRDDRHKIVFAGLFDEAKLGHPDVLGSELLGANRWKLKRRVGRVCCISSSL